ncbi:MULTISPECIES: NlpC/P60 family protein [unclassified Sphingomonas]|uniref:NlpC/P60 family protein n=1 Tax=unclassified Sphingomonas TaxID=196159 RepID=UPI00138EFFFB|nr:MULTISPECIES: NlpC/P60 family protein [unclassified Sphingomonas]
MQSSGSSWTATESATSIGDTPPRSRFALRGRSVRLDGRTEAVRRDLADIRLADRVFAPHYAVAVRRSVGRMTDVTTSAGGPVLSQLLPGEPFDVLEFTSTHAWGRSPIDGSVGLVARDALIGEYAVSHIVVVRESVVYADRSTATPLPMPLPMGARVAATVTGDWAEVDGGYAPADHLRALSDLSGDAVAAALALRDVAVVAGGRSGAGVDAAGLVFLAHGINGEAPARFVDLQAAEFGVALAGGDPLRRGDLLFFADHVAMLVDGDTAIHADGSVTVEPIAALDRFGPVLARRRPA